MGFFDTLSDLVGAAMPWSEVEAEAPPKEEEEKEEESSEDKEEPEQEESKEDEPEEEEEEEEEELVDPKETLEEECRESKACAPAKHHFDECVERVTNASGPEDLKLPNEDCVEEFFHLAHCANACAAPKLWRALK